MTSAAGHAGSREAALELAFRLVHDLQADVPGARAEVAALAEEAAARRWDEVLRACLFAQVVEAWVTGDGVVARRTADFFERCAAEGDDVMLALALALRSDLGFSEAVQQVLAG